MDLQRVSAVFLRQVFLLRLNAPRITNVFLWPALDILLWGFIATYLDRVGKAQVSFLTVLLGAAVLWNFLVRVQTGMMTAFFEDIWAHNLFNFFASPLRIWEYTLGLIATAIMTSFTGLSLVIFMAQVIFGYNIFRLGLFLIPFMGVLFVFGVALGVFTCALVLRLGPSAEWLAWPIPFILGPFAGIFYPVSSLPKYVQPFSRAIAPSYVFEGMRGVLANGTVSHLNLLLGFVIAAAYLLAAALFFVYVFRLVLRNGLFTRFSAESM